MDEIQKKYNPKETEQKWYKFWDEKNLFASKPSQSKPFTVVIPPPNVTGALHIGHALNNTLQDVIIRFRRMQGYNALWVPGTDHGGIATQNVVEKLLLKEGKTREQLGREKFLQRMWGWKNESGDTILNQLKHLGCSCDWSRTRFTMDEVCSRAVLPAFVELYRRGLIYRGKRIVNWCVRCKTALADIEVEHKEESGDKSKLWYIKYPLKLSLNSQLSTLNCITVATTRPETMLGDTAVAVNPADERYKDFVGKTVILPLVEREIPIVAAEEVDKDFGSGAVKVTPAHDPLDFEIAAKHNLPHVVVIDYDGKMTCDATKNYAHLDRYECRKKVLEDLESKKLIEKIEDYTHSVGVCYRCGTVIEPLVSEQWFLKMNEIASRALGIVGEEWIYAYERENGFKNTQNKPKEIPSMPKVKFYPDTWTLPYIRWLASLNDWCLSRQIWWGHRIPIWYCGWCVGENINITLCEPILGKSGFGWVSGSLKQLLEDCISLEIIEKKTLSIKISGDVDPNRTAFGIKAQIEKPEICEKCSKSDWLRDTDVLDTWFSSALWPFSVFGWSTENEHAEVKSENAKQIITNYELRTTNYELAYYYPTSVLVTGYEILYLWVARMIMMGLEFMAEVPFTEVFIHGIVRDVYGKKMSKSLGNVIDPLEIMDRYGTDALRFALTHSAGAGKDIRLSEDSFISARNFTNKIWNAARFVLTNLQTLTASRLTAYDLKPMDRWILQEFNQLVKAVTESLVKYDLSEYARLVYEFFWFKFCDWYIEFIKPRLTIPAEVSTVLNVLSNVLVGSIKLLHPVMPFVTEEIYQRVKSVVKEITREESIMISMFPEYDPEFITDENASKEINFIMQLINEIRTIRAELSVEPKRPVDIVVNSQNTQKHLLFDKYLPNLRLMCKINNVRFNLPKPKHSAVCLVDDVEIYVLLEGVIDFEKERLRLKKNLENLKKQIALLDEKLSDEEFLRKAPVEEIERLKYFRKQSEEKANRIEQLGTVLNSHIS